MAELYPFQKESVEKFVNVPAVLIGDDMGLGKTVQGIALDMRKRQAHGAAFAKRGKPLTLVVAPLSVLGVWRSHFQEWQPSLKVCVIDSKNRKDFVEAILKGQADIFICHWEAIRLMPELQKITWFHVIADEIHRAKNRKAQQTVALKKLHTEHKLGLSGTPADNAPQDFWSILNWLYPRYFTSYWNFFRKHVIVKRHDLTGACGCKQFHQRAYDEILGCANVDELMSAISKFYIRRLKEDVLTDLPEKYFTRIEVELTVPQRRAYDEMRRRMLAWVGQHEDQPIAAPIVVAQLTRLQQFACAYAKFEDGKLVLTEPSSKVDLVVQLIEDNPNDQIVVFSQSKQVANMVARRLQANKVPVSVLTGDTKQADRPGVVEAFQAGRTRVFVGTIAAGGVGITLTAASTIVFMDRAWSPSINRQAEDRLHRIGQKNAVQVIDLVATNTVDAGRLQRIELKWSWVKQILGDKVEEDGVLAQVQ